MRRPDSAVSVNTGDDIVLGNLKFVPKDDEDARKHPHEEGNEPDLELAMKVEFGTTSGNRKGEEETIREQVQNAPTSQLQERSREGKRPLVSGEEQVAHSLRNGPESSSTSDSERTESDTESGAPKDDKVQGEIVSSTVTSGVSIPGSDPEKAHEAQAGPDPEPMQEDQTGSDSGKLHSSDSNVNFRPSVPPLAEISSYNAVITDHSSPINTEATTIKPHLSPEITSHLSPFHLRVAKLSKRSEVKKTNLSALMVGSIRSQVPTAVDNLLDQKLDDVSP
ncbi:hypothetical protein Tco_0086626 [Tanacetum coccineum]